MTLKRTRTLGVIWGVSQRILLSFLLTRTITVLLPFLLTTKVIWNPVIFFAHAQFVTRSQVLPDFVLLSRNARDYMHDGGVFKWLSKTQNQSELLRPTTTQANAATNQSELLSVTCNLLKAREKSRVQDAIGFGFASHWLKNWRENFQPITKRNNRNRVITVDSHLKAALSVTKSSIALTTFL